MIFEAIREKALAAYNDFTRPDQVRFLVGAGTCGRAAGALEVIAALEEEIIRRSLQDTCRVAQVGCLGLCYAEPMVELQDLQGRRILYRDVRPESVSRLIESHIIGETPLLSQALAVMEPPALNGIPIFTDLPMLKGQVRIALKNSGHIDPASLDHYIARGGYASLARVLDMEPEAVIDCVEASLLRGRGGAGFPTGVKWRACRQAVGDIRYLICNGDEGDPGAFMDRSIMEGDPHAVIEGMLIGAWAIGAREGALYVRGEYPLAIERLRNAISQAEAVSLLGEKILGRDFEFKLRLVCNAGAFVSGEETALINSVQGSVAEPRPRPPFPAQSGLWGQPTCINNVETWANVPIILEKGAEWFKGIGVEKNGGTKLFSLAGKIKHTGLVEVPMGTTVRKVVFEIGGGISDNNPIKAVQNGGPSGGCIPESKLDLPLTYEGLVEAGAIMGSGGMVVMDSETCMVDIARYFLEFTTKESCGKCTPCREGTVNMLAIMERICAGEAVPEDLDLLERLANGVATASLCALGKTAPNPVRSTLRYFRDEYLAHIVDKHCPAGVCSQLVPAPCQKACPAGIDVASYVALIADGRYDEAVQVIREDNPFPWVCGTICPAPCEKECRRGSVDQPVSIRALKAFAAQYALEHSGGYPAPIRAQQDEKAAVVGSGPSGLSAAYFLARNGYRVTVFEVLPQAGGMLRVGIPAHRLPRELLDQEIESLTRLGIQIKTNTSIGNDAITDLFKEGFAAVYLGTGAHKPLPLNIPGETVTGVVQGIDYLKDLNLNRTVPKARQVVVIGGGHVAVDAARAVLRKGAHSVTILYPRSQREMPADASEIKQAMEEGIEILFQAAPLEVLIQNGRAGGLRCIKTELGKADTSGRRRPVPVPGSQFDLAADLVIGAVGQVPDSGLLKNMNGLDLNSCRATLKVDPRTLATGIKGVFAGGDGVTGPATVIEAIAQGKRAALYMDAYMRGTDKPRHPLAAVRRRRVPAFEIAPEALENLKRPEMPLLPLRKRKSTFRAVELGLSETMARDEARRCLRCDLK